MELNKECLSEFWKWYLLPNQRKAYKTRSIIGGDGSIKIRFLSMSFTERLGVYVDFFDSVGLRVLIDFNGNWYFTIDVKGVKNEMFKTHFFTDVRLKTRLEARIKAIEEANEIYNKTKTKTK